MKKPGSCRADQRVVLPAPAFPQPGVSPAAVRVPVPVNESQRTEQRRPLRQPPSSQRHASAGSTRAAMLPTSPHSLRTPASTPKPAAALPWHCAACRVQCSSAADFERHERGKKHQAITTRHRAVAPAPLPTAPAPLSSPPPRAPSLAPPSSSPSSESAGERSPPSLSAEPVAAPPTSSRALPQEPSPSAHSEAESPLSNLLNPTDAREASQDLEPAAKRGSSQNDAKRREQSKEKKEEHAQGRKKETVSAPSPSPSPLRVSSSPSLSCSVCCVRVHSAAELSRHCASKNHLRNCDMFTKGAAHALELAKQFFELVVVSAPSPPPPPPAAAAAAPSVRPLRFSTVADLLGDPTMLANFAALRDELSFHQQLGAFMHAFRQGLSGLLAYQLGADDPRPHTDGEEDDVDNVDGYDDYVDGDEDAECDDDDTFLGAL